MQCCFAEWVKAAIHEAIQDEIDWNGSVLEGICISDS